MYRGDSRFRPAGSAAAAFGPSGAITINDSATATPYPSTIDVSGLSGTITDVDITLNGFGHGHPTDVDILLAGPSGGALEVLSDVPADDDQGLGACDAASGIDLTFSDQAAGKLPGDQPLAGGLGRSTYQRRAKLRPCAGNAVPPSAREPRCRLVAAAPAQPIGMPGRAQRELFPAP